MGEAQKTEAALGLIHDPEDFIARLWRRIGSAPEGAENDLAIRAETNRTPAFNPKHWTSRILAAVIHRFAFLGLFASLFAASAHDCVQQFALNTPTMLRIKAGRRNGFRFVA